jgi:glycosyltransferase involved in cell wall biosynthesis
MFNYSSLLSYLLLKISNLSKSYIIIFHSNIDGPGNIFRKFYYKIRKIIIINLVFLFNNKLVFLTNAQKQSYKKLCFFKKKMEYQSVIINNFIESNYIIQNKTNNLRVINVLFVGRLSYFKGVSDLINLIEMFRKNSRIKFSIVGNGPLGKDVPNYENVKYLGSINHDFIYDIYDNNNILILPSYTEVFPLVILEAMARGLVILASDLPGMSEIIIEGRNGYLFPPGDIIKMNKHISYLMENPKKIKQISNNNLKDIWKFTDEKQGSKYLNLLNMHQKQNLDLEY